MRSCRRLQQKRYHLEVCTTLFFRVVRELILILVDKISSWNFYKYAGVMKSEDALDLKSKGRDIVQVQVLSPVPLSHG